MSRETEKEKITVLSPSRREIDLHIPPEAVEQEFDKILADYASKAKLAGFRKGKAPRDMVRKMFLAEIRKDIVDSLVPRALDAELKTAGLFHVNVPVIQDVHFEDDQTLHSRVAFEVLPEFEVPSYDKIRLTPQNESVDDKDVQQALDEIRHRAAEYVPAENRGVRDGDYVVVEIQGRDSKTKKFLPIEKVVVLAGHAENEKMLNDNLQGLKAGEKKIFSVTYEKDVANKKLAGRDIEYRLRVKSVKEKKIPPLDDELAKTLGECDTLDDLKMKIRTRLLASKASFNRSKQASEILNNLSTEVSIELPESLIEEETRAVLGRILRAHPSAEMNRDQAGRLAVESRKQAEQNIKNNLILRKIAEKEGIKVLEEDIQEEMKTLAEANRIPLATVIETVNKEGRRGDIEENLLFRKTVDFLLGQVIIE